MYDYLVQKGVDKSRLLLEDKSTSTVENIEYSMRIIEKTVRMPQWKLDL